MPLKTSPGAPSVLTTNEASACAPLRRQRTNNRATVNTGTWSVPIVNVDRRSSSVTLLSCRLSLFVWLTTAICVMAQTGGDRYPVVRNGKVGFIDSQGHEVIAPQFFPVADMARFHDSLAPVAGLAAVCVNRKWGYVDTSGGWIIAPELSSADDFRHDLARVAWRDGYGYIDRSGTALWKATTKKSP